MDRPAVQREAANRGGRGAIEVERKRRLSTRRAVGRERPDKKRDRAVHQPRRHEFESGYRHEGRCAGKPVLISGRARHGRNADRRVVREAVGRVRARVGPKRDNGGVQGRRCRRRGQRPSLRTHVPSIHPCRRHGDGVRPQKDVGDVVPHAQADLARVERRTVAQTQDDPAGPRPHETVPSDFTGKGHAADADPRRPLQARVDDRGRAAVRDRVVGHAQTEHRRLGPSPGPWFLGGHWRDEEGGATPQERVPRDDGPIVVAGEHHISRRAAARVDEVRGEARRDEAVGDRNGRRARRERGVEQERRRVDRLKHATIGPRAWAVENAHDVSRLRPFSLRREDAHQSTIGRDGGDSSFITEPVRLREDDLGRVHVGDRVAVARADVGDRVFADVGMIGPSREHEETPGLPRRPDRIGLVAGQGQVECVVTHEDGVVVSAWWRAVVAVVSDRPGAVQELDLAPLEPVPRDDASFEAGQPDEARRLLPGGSGRVGGWSLNVHPRDRQVGEQGTGRVPIVAGADHGRAEVHVPIPAHGAVEPHGETVEGDAPRSHLDRGRPRTGSRALMEEKGRARVGRDRHGTGQDEGAALRIGPRGEMDRPVSIGQGAQVVAGPGGDVRSGRRRHTRVRVGRPAREGEDLGLAVIQRDPKCEGLARFVAHR